eukprot:5254879-Alexandrium_andersonii.AAC.1
MTALAHRNDRAGLLISSTRESVRGARARAAGSWLHCTLFLGRNTSHLKQPRRGMLPKAICVRCALCPAVSGASLGFWQCPEAAS